MNGFAPGRPLSPLLAACCTATRSTITCVSYGRERSTSGSPAGPRQPLPHLPAPGDLHGRGGSPRSSASIPRQAAAHAGRRTRGEPPPAGVPSGTPRPLTERNLIRARDQPGQVVPLQPARIALLPRRSFAGTARRPDRPTHRDHGQSGPRISNSPTSEEVRRWRWAHALAGVEAGDEQHRPAVLRHPLQTRGGGSWLSPIAVYFDALLRDPTLPAITWPLVEPHAPSRSCAQRPS